MKSKYFIASMVLVFIINTAFGQANCIDTSIVQTNCICITIYNPVLGCNGIVYSNSCNASCDGVVKSVKYLDEYSIKFVFNQDEGEELAKLKVIHDELPLCTISYVWNTGDTSQEISINPNATETYSVTTKVVWVLEDNNTSHSYEVSSEYHHSGNSLTVVDKNEEKATIALYPNPAEKNTVLYVNSNNRGIESIKIIDVLGGVVLNRRFECKGRVGLDVSNLNTGLYLFNIGLKNEILVIKKVLIMD